MNIQILFDSLQKEFCPSLDSSLVAALLADLALDDTEDIDVRQVEELRSTLRELSAQADESQLSEFADFHIASSSDDTSSTPDIYSGNTPSTSASLRSISTDSSQHSFSSPLGFLQAALPHVPFATLCAALDNKDGEHIDMWDIVAGILTQESIREMEERGLDGLDDDFSHTSEDELSWETVGSKRRSSSVPKPAKAKRKSNRGKTITLVNIRQQQHARPVYSPKSGAPPRPAPAPDPWTQLSSLSTHLATLLPPHPASFFQSFFHSPDHATPYDALCACLESISKSRSDTPTDEHRVILFNLLDILLPEYDDLDSEERSRLISDTELSLQATQNRGDDALDLIKLLRDLDTDSTTGRLEKGVYHFSPTSLTPTPQPSPKLSDPPTIQRPPRPKPPPPSSSTARNKPSPYQWQAVHFRKPYIHKPHTLSAQIPAYTRDVNGIKVRGAGNAYGKSGKGDLGELGQSLQEQRRRVGESMRKRDELLLEASKMWQKGNKKTRGGEVAFYFAERAREFQELAKVEALNAARTIIEAKRLASPDQSTIDLHGTTVAEAIIIVKQILHAHEPSPCKPLKIITGRGAHSVNHVSVLKPAIKKELVEDGWAVGGWDGGLIVRGRHSGRS